MNALDQPVSFSYGNPNYPYTAKNPHRGVDLNAYKPMPVVVQGYQIALSGNTGSYQGYTYAYHIHIQAGRDEWAQKTIEPTPYIGKAGTVVKTGWASEWGNYVCVRVGDVNVYYCHLSRIDTYVGYIIGDDMDSKTEEILRSAINSLTNTNEVLQSAVNSLTRQDEIHQSALNAARAENEQLKKELGQGSTKLKQGRYVVE